jgi:enoyl-CoA hydratase
MDYKILKFEQREQTGILTISRPDAMNALNTAFFDELDHFLGEIPDIRVLVITGEDKAFVAGADISEMVDMKPKHARHFSQRGQDIFNKIKDLRIPVIAAVNGFALGGGMELAMACDIRFASDNAKFGQPEVSLGLIPGFSGTQRLARYSSLGNALYMLLTGEMIDAKRAYEMGVVQKVTTPEDLMGEVLKVAKTIASKGPWAIEQVKKVTRQGLLIHFHDANRLESEVFASMFGHEGVEGMKAFLEKRKPNW